MAPKKKPKVMYASHEGHASTTMNGMMVTAVLIATVTFAAMICRLGAF